MREPSSSTSPSGGDRPVAIEMPRLSSDEGTATLSSWLVSEGDTIVQGAIIAELETDKATVELEAPVTGRIESLLVAAGTEGLKPGAVLGRIVPDRSAAPAVEGPRPTQETRSLGAVPPSTAVDSIGRSPATPLARRLARSQGIDLDRVKGTGVGGRIEKADVERSAQLDAGARGAAAKTREREPAAEASGETAAASAAEVATASVATPAMRRARPLLAFAAGDAPRPAVQLKLRCRMEAAVAARARLNEGMATADGASRVTLNDFVLRAAALALRDVPEANPRSEREPELRRSPKASTGYAGGSIARAEGVDVALVVATEAGSGIALVRDADRKGLAVLSEEIRRRADALRAGGAPEDELGAALLVTSFARFGIESAHPMLPPGRVAVLAVGALVEEPVVREGGIAIGARMALTLAFDPTAVGGAVMARLLATIRDHLEDPLGMML